MIEFLFWLMRWSTRCIWIHPIKKWLKSCRGMSVDFSNIFHLIIRTQVRASQTVPTARTSLGWQRAILVSAAGERFGGPGGRTRCANKQDNIHNQHNQHNIHKVLLIYINSTYLKVLGSNPAFCTKHVACLLQLNEAEPSWNST